MRTWRVIGTVIGTGRTWRVIGTVIGTVTGTVRNWDVIGAVAGTVIGTVRTWRVIGSVKDYRMKVFASRIAYPFITRAFRPMWSFIASGSWGANLPAPLSKAIKTAIDTVVVIAASAYNFVIGAVISPVIRPTAGAVIGNVIGTSSERPVIGTIPERRRNAP